MMASSDLHPVEPLRAGVAISEGPTSGLSSYSSVKGMILLLGSQHKHPCPPWSVSGSPSATSRFIRRSLATLAAASTSSLLSTVGRHCRGQDHSINKPRLSSIGWEQGPDTGHSMAPWLSKIASYVWLA